MQKILNYQDSLDLRFRHNVKLNNSLSMISLTPQKQYQIRLKSNQYCCICGMSNCNQQAIDHNKVSLFSLNSLILQNCRNQQQITQLKIKIKLFYKDIKKIFINEINKKQQQVQKYLNQFYFYQPLKQKIDISLITDIIQKDIRKLPNKGITKLTKQLQKFKTKQNLNKQCSLNQQVDKISQFTNKFLTNFDNNNFIQNMKSLISGINIKQLYRLQQPKLTPKKSISQFSNPQQSQIFDLNKIYQWRNVRVTKNSKTVGLSNKNISDRQVMQQIPILSNYKNLQQFQIRNNKISSLSCNLIANNMSFLTSVDIRGNKIDDRGIIKLVNGITHLKSFFISQTLATDQSGQQIANKLPQLQTFWSQHTNITNQIALKIANKPKLKVLSLLGNPINDQCKQKMKKIYISKGYLAI